MKVTKEKSEFGLNIFLVDGDKYLAFTFGGNGDLYWSIHSKNDIDKHDHFIITKENYAIYSLFEQLFSDIENINIYDEEDDKDKYRIFNYANYNELFDDSTKTITWYSDETAHEVANILTIKKNYDFFKIDFYIQPYIEDYDRDFYSSRYIPIRFRNSGSSYDPFNIIFMRMYNNMREIDDVNDVGHQMHVEEYLYRKTKLKKH